MDHMWGPRFLLFLEARGFEREKQDVDALLRAELPTSFMGIPTHFDTSPKGDCLSLCETSSPPVNHLIEFHHTRAFLSDYLGVRDPQKLSGADWLMLDQHRLLGTTTGPVFHDGLGALGRIRQQLCFYPDDVWFFLMSCRWHDVAEEEAFVGRCGASGDEFGSRLIAARLTEVIMRIAFLQERQYAPYSKWCGRAFLNLKSAEHLAPLLARVLSAASWQERDQALSEAYTFIAETHNALGVCQPLPVKISPAYDGRPGDCIHAQQFADALLELVKDKELKEHRTRELTRTQ